LIISEVQIKNFRSLKDVTTPVYNRTIVVGANGSGKSNFLKALDSFFRTDAKFSIEDFWSKKSDHPIEIIITFSQLTPEEKEKFRDYIHDNKFIVKKEVSLVGNKVSSKYFGFILSIAEFNDVRSAENVEEMRERYEELRKSFAGLPKATTKKTIMQALEDWEKLNPDKCKLLPKESQFFGYTNVGSGYVKDFIGFLLIPAVKEAQEESEESRGSVLGRLIDFTVRGALKKNPQVINIEKQTKQTYQNLLQGEEMKNVEGRLNEKLNDFAPGVKTKFVVDTEQVDILSGFRVTAKLIEDQYETDVSGVGHGSQRAFIMALLEHNAEQINKKQTVGKTTTLVLGIEEPELYQHPSRQRHLSSVLERLSKPGKDINFQVIYVTHSPLFVRVTDLDNILRFHKTRGKSGPGSTSVTHITLQECANKLQEAYPGKKFSHETLLPRLRAIMTPWMNEAFFAKAVVLVEGENDRALIQGYGKAKGKDFDAMDIAVVPCNAKPNIDRPLVIFKKLGIPVYPVWDLDQDKDEEERKENINRALLKLCEYPSSLNETKVERGFCCFQKDFYNTIKGEIGQQFEENIKKYATQFEVDLNEAKKKPYILEQAVSDCASANFKSTTLDNMLEMITSLVS
jgi:putative ATP-dependent endonuclease of OLD family